MTAGVLAALLALAGVWHVRQVWRVFRAPVLVPDAALPDDGPRISVIIPARNEAARIGACLVGLAAQRYRRFEVLVLDDHSSDGTAGVARSFTSVLPGLRVLSSQPLPPGWAGKCWACWQAAREARGDVLLFLDADVAPGPELLAAVAGRMAHNHADARPHGSYDAPLDVLTLVPLVTLGSTAERLVLPAFVGMVSAIYPFEQVNDPSSPAAFAIGQCLVFRRAAYEQVGGHAAVRASVLEDMELARLAKGTGLRLEAFHAPDLLAVRMYSGWRDLAEGLRKNAVAGFANGGRRAGWVGAQLCFVAVLPLDLLLVGAWLLAQEHSGGSWFVLAGVVLFVFGAACWGVAIRHRHRVSALWGFGAPLGIALYFGLAVSALLRLRRGEGVTWKGRVFTR
jgi:glycosyltransferase involved in cell wall biosynthesis